MKGRRSSYTRPWGLKTLTYGESDIDLTAVEQLVEHGQVEAIGQAMAERVRTSGTDVRGIIGEVEEVIKDSGLDALTSRPHPWKFGVFPASRTGGGDQQAEDAEGEGIRDYQVTW